MIYLPETLTACHAEIKRLHEEIDDLRLYCDEDVNSVKTIQLKLIVSKITKYFKLSLKYKSKSAAKLLVALFIYKYDRPASRDTIYNILSNLQNNRASPDGKTIDVLVTHTRKAFRELNLPDPIITHWGMGYSLTPEAREFVERFK